MENIKELEEYVTKILSEKKTTIKEAAEDNDIYINNVGQTPASTPEEPNEQWADHSVMSVMTPRPIDTDQKNSTIRKVQVADAEHVLSADEYGYPAGPVDTSEFNLDTEYNVIEDNVEDMSGYVEIEDPTTKEKFLVPQDDVIDIKKDNEPKETSDPTEIKLEDPEESLSLGDVSNLVFENRTITEGCSKKNKSNKKPPFFGKKSDSKSDDDSKKGKSKKGKRPFWLKKKGKSNEEKLEEARQYGFSK